MGLGKMEKKNVTEKDWWASVVEGKVDWLRSDRKHCRNESIGAQARLTTCEADVIRKNKDRKRPSHNF